MMNRTEILRLQREKILINISEDRSDLLSDHLHEYSGMLLRRIKQMKNSKSPEIAAKIREVDQEMMLVEGLRTWQ